jgi:UDP-N-acetylmuramoylalanine-D-glutamate ligase
MRLVFGLGRSGLGVLRFLKKRGLPARFFDENPCREDLEAALSLGFEPDPTPAPGRYREVIAAPGVPLDHPLLKRTGAPIIGEAELAWRLGDAEILGVTGTAGKTSTTVFLAHLLRAVGIDALEGGNIGTPLVDVIDRAHVVVAELSSFQLERIGAFRPRVAVLLNLGVDHLDRHKSVEAYHQAKLNLLKNLTSDDALVYNAADERILRAAQASPAKRYPFLPQATPRPTNLEAALQAARAYLEIRGLAYDEAALVQAASKAPSVPGRFEVVGRKGGLVFIDDSIATRTLSVEASLRAAPAPVAWILGGLDKGAQTAPLRPLVASKVALILAVGRDGPKLARAFADLVPVIEVPQHGPEAFVRAIEVALSRLDKGSVLLAPLAASFDMFPDYKARSEAFRRAVKEVLWTPSSS